MTDGLPRGKILWRLFFCLCHKIKTRRELPKAASAWQAGPASGPYFLWRFSDLHKPKIVHDVRAYTDKLSVLVEERFVPISGFADQGAGEDDELAYHGDDDDFRGLSGTGGRLAGLPESGVTAENGRRHVQHGAQASATDADLRSAFPFARLACDGGNTCKACSLPSDPATAAIHQVFTRASGRTSVNSALVDCGH